MNGAKFSLSKYICAHKESGRGRERDIWSRSWKANTAH